MITRNNHWTNFLKLKFWKLLSNSLATFNLENVNLLSNPNVNPKMELLIKKRETHYIDEADTKTHSEVVKSDPYNGLIVKNQNVSATPKSE